MIRPTHRPFRVACGLCGLLLAGGAAAAAPPAADGLRHWCGDCHGGDAAEGGLSLDGLLAADRPPAVGSREHADWVAAWRNVRAGIMPPPDAPRPSEEERRALLAFVSRDVLGVDPGRPDPGRIPLRRLNRVEYANTVRDLTGIQEDLADELPADDTGHGFDTNAEVLTLSPLLLERYVAIAARVGERVAAEATRGAGHPRPLRRLFPAGPPPADAAARAAHLRTTLEGLAARAFRRPVDGPTIDRLQAVAEQAIEAAGGSFEWGIAAAVTAVLASPRFLFRVEQVEEAASDDAGARPIDEYSLATRLSYFLWSTMPDDELFALAAAGRLRAELPGQVERMVQDGRAEAFVRNFTGQWLQVRDVEAVPVDASRILGTRTRDEAERIFNQAVRRGMRRETELLFAHVLREGLPATELIVSRRGFLDGPLAGFYGIPGVEGDRMRLVDLPAGSHRGGLLTQGSFLVVTSNPTRTSPVKRGLFILENLLGTPAAPPPPDVPPLERVVESLGRSATMRDLMESHRRDALCASCHSRFDPLGLALEAYDALGRWRGDAAIDTSGRLPTGERFTGVDQLAALIAGPRRRDFHRCLAEKMLTYAVGRGLEYFDATAVDTIVERLDDDPRLLTVVQAVVASVPFQMQRGPAAGPPDAPSSR